MKVLEAILARRSIRKFTASSVSSDDEDAVIDAAFAAPSAENLRPWHFVVIRDPAMRVRLSKVHDWSWMLAVTPLVVAVLGRADSRWFIEDCSAAVENMLLTATERGLGSIWVGIRDQTAESCGSRPCEYERSCARLLGIPSDWRVLCLVGIGHPAQHKAPRSQRESEKLSYERFGVRRYLTDEP